LTTIWRGAALAAALAVTALIVRSRVRRRAREEDRRGSGVLGVVLKSALFAAAQTVVRVGAARLASKALPSRPALAHEAGTSE